MQGEGESATVRMRRIKDWSTERLRNDSIFKEVILGEPDELTVKEFLDRLPVYLRLLRSESGRSG
ncbi:MAG: hypothetical protein ABSB56_00870 [Nitrososphaerales archaeon]|jgi:hypothetical protein